jgi:hypothetical protein
MAILLPSLFMSVNVSRCDVLSARLGFTSGLLKACGGDDFRDLLWAQLMVEFAEHPDVTT